MANQRLQSQPVIQQSNAPRPRILRIGILLGGKIVEERLIRERTPVTIGQSIKNTFSIPIEGLPLEFTLFALDEGRYSLRFLARMDGRLSDSSGQVNTLEALKGRGARQQGDYWQVPMSESARGKLTLGDLTILFQFVTEPPRQPKPMLPASVRGTFADRIDPQLAVILGISIFVHFGIVVAALLGLFGEPETRGLSERAYNLTFKPDEYKIEDVQEPQVADNGAGSAGSAEEKKPEKVKAPPKEQGGGREAGEKVAMTEDEASRFADLLTGEGENGKSEGDMSKRRPGADLGAQISDVRDSGKNVAIGGGAGRGARDGDARVGTGKGPNINAPGGVESAGGGKNTEHAPTGRISVSTKQAIDESSLTADAVLNKIQQAYMPGIKRCYKNYLNKDASARGKVGLSLTVNQTGRTTQGSASGFPADEVNSCITGLMSGWTFPIPKDKDGDPTEASFRITLQLVPD